MKTLFTILFLFTVLFSYSQQHQFLIQGQIIDETNKPISDVYIINLNNQEKDVSQLNGVFTVWASSTDSLVLSHISYFRKIVTIHSLLVNPTIKLIAENVDIPEILVSPDLITDIDRARLNMMFMQEYNVPAYTKIKDEVQPVQTLMIENNELLRSEAASISLLRFSPSYSIEKLFVKLRRQDRLKDFNSSTKQKNE